MIMLKARVNGTNGPIEVLACLLANRRPPPQLKRGLMVGYFHIKLIHSLNAGWGDALKGKDGSGME